MSKPPVPCFECPGCGHRFSSVIDSRFETDTDSRMRRRRCCKCGKTYCTLEIAYTEHQAMNDRIRSLESQLNATRAQVCRLMKV